MIDSRPMVELRHRRLGKSLGVAEIGWSDND